MPWCQNSITLPRRSNSTPMSGSGCCHPDDFLTTFFAAASLLMKLRST